MSRLARVTQRIFGLTAGVNQLKQIGSLAAGSPLTTTDPTVMQALSNYTDGWFSCVEGANSPAIEDMNSLCFVFARQLAYLFQAGVAEWINTTTYYIGSLVQNGTGTIYKSLTDNNIGNALSDVTNWAPYSSSQYNRFIGGAAGLSGITINAGDSILVQSTVTETAQVLVSANDVRIDFMPGTKLQSTLTTGSLLKVTGARFRSSNLSVQATGAMPSGNVLTELAGNDAIISAAYFELNNAAIALTNALLFSGNRNDITSGSIVATLGTYTNPYSVTGTNNDSRIRG